MTVKLKGESVYVQNFATEASSDFIARALIDHLFFLDHKKCPYCKATNVNISSHLLSSHTPIVETRKILLPLHRSINQDGKRR